MPHLPAWAGASDCRIEILLDESLGTISPDLYGYLLENLGTVIYDGIWVGEKSNIANVGGIRKAVIDHLRLLKASVIRWPGGNYADYYDWEDGTGVRARRPRRTNEWTEEMPPEAPVGPQRYDPNLFGTPEFMQLCKLSGGRPFLSVNTRALSPQSFFRWVEYCNSPAGTTTLADVRKRDGSPEPYGVRYWSVGNEVWAAGGNMTADEYATLYKRFSANIPRYGVDLCLVAAGPPPGWNTEWIHQFMRAITRTVLPIPIDALSMHYYATLPLNYLRPNTTLLDAVEYDSPKTTPIDAVNFSIEEWYQTLHASVRLQGLIDAYWQVLGVYDSKRSIKIALDEWGAIYNRTATANPLNLTGRGVTLRDALAASLTLDILNTKCSIMSVANYTGLINQEGGIFQADGDRFVTTPVFHVFRMYSGHQGGRSLRTLFDVPTIHPNESKQSTAIAKLSGSASLRGNVLTLTVTNPHASQSQEADISIRGGIANSATVETLNSTDLHAQNTFDHPDNLVPTSEQLRINGSSIRHSFPAASVTKFAITLNRSAT